jgi:putative membrane protein
LVSAAEKALKSALKEEQHPFFVGAAKIVPEEFNIGQGMGPGGIVTLVVITGGQKILYITIDGNNMVSGLREEIIQALSTSFDECEILTTDTHIVNAIKNIRRGYYPIGEVIDHERLISYIKDIAAKAVDDAEKAEVSFTKIPINNVRVIGEEKLVNLTMLIDITFNILRWATPLIFIPAVIAAMLPFLFI